MKKFSLAWVTGCTCICLMMLAGTAQGAITNASTIVTTDVMLADAAALKLTVNVVSKDNNQVSEAKIRDSITSWFLLDGEGKAVTLSQFKHDPNFAMHLINIVKTNTSAAGVSLLGYLVVTPPSESFEFRSRTLSAVLTTGETIELTFAGRTQPSSDQVSSAYQLLSTLAYSDLKNLQDLLNKKLQPKDHTDWTYPILSLKKLCCNCK